MCHKNNVLEKSIIEVIKYVDRNKNTFEYVKDNHGEKWRYVDVQERNCYKSRIESTHKHGVGMSAH